MIIVVGNEKGGCGKTTIAVHIAALSTAEGKDTLLIDADPGQQSSARWAARRRESHPERPPIPCVSLNGNIRPGLQDLARRYAVLVIDTGAEDSPELRAAATVADRLIIPVQPESLDLWTLPTVASIYERAGGLNPALRPLLAINRAPYQLWPAGAAEIRAWIAANVPTLATAPAVSLINRAAYGRAISEGLSVSEMPRRDPKATTEIETLYDTLCHNEVEI